MGSFSELMAANAILSSEIESLRSQLSERDREIERLKGIVQSQAFLKECADTPLMRDVLAQLSASQAREREAVERAEETEVSKKEFMSALAAARKALEGWDEAYRAFVGAFDTPMARMTRRDAFADDACKRMRDFNEGIAAINGDSHAE